MLRFACPAARGDRGGIDSFAPTLCPEKRNLINSRENTAESDKTDYVNPHLPCISNHLRVLCRFSSIRLCRVSGLVYCRPWTSPRTRTPWRRPYYVALKADGGLQKLAMPLRFEALCCAVEGEYPSRAASMREWSPAAKEGILKWLDSVTWQKPAVREVDLWRVTKDTREPLIPEATNEVMKSGGSRAAMRRSSIRRLRRHPRSLEGRDHQWRREHLVGGSGVHARRTPSSCFSQSRRSPLRHSASSRGRIRRTSRRPTASRT
jgi:hypothetical protein